VCGGGGVSPQPPPVSSIHLDDATAPLHSPHTSYRWRGERVIEPIKCMRSPHTSYRWRGERVIEPIKWMQQISLLLKNGLNKIHIFLATVY